MRTLPKVTTLREAVNAVIKSNMSDNYPPNRFRNMTANTTDNDLVRVCTNLVRKDDALSDLFNAFLDHPNLLTIEVLLRFTVKSGDLNQILSKKQVREFLCLMR